jgi:hypothetical protein
MNLARNTTCRGCESESSGPGRKGFGDVARLEPDVAEAFPNADSVNEALRSLIRVSQDKAPNIRRTS